MAENELDIEVEELQEEELEEELEAEEEENPFYENLAETLDERVLSRMAGELIADYKKDKESRSTSGTCQRIHELYDYG